MDNKNKSDYGCLDLLAQELYWWDRQHVLTAGTASDILFLLFKDGVTRHQSITNVTVSTNVGIMFSVVVLSLTNKGAHFFDNILGTKKPTKCDMCSSKCCATGTGEKKSFIGRLVTLQQKKLHTQLSKQCYPAAE
jgi:hypothetical protein